MIGYLKLQLQFWKQGWRERLSMVPAATAGPLPPPRLRHRVHGSIDAATYLEVGRRSWACLVDLLRETGRDPEALSAILDFGCGSGRVIRQIPVHDRPDRTVWGVDVDPAAIRWCSRNLGGYHFATVPDRPPTALADDQFDFIFAISVFSHLDEQRQFAWLAELQRLLRPGGIVVASVHGEYHRSVTRRRFDMGTGFAFTRLRTGWFKKDGLPDFYQDAQHTRAYVEREWSRTFRVLLYRERGMNQHQDAVVLTSR